MTIKEFYSDLVLKKIEKLKSIKANQIFVILGQTTLFDFESIEGCLVDIDTFILEKGEQIFNKEWFSKVFMILNQQKEYHILSFAQFSYLTHYIDPNFFIERVLIIKDNLRQIYPIEKQDYLEVDQNENIESRPIDLPIYQSEQLVINERYYYSIKSLIKIEAFFRALSTLCEFNFPFLNSFQAKNKFSREII